MTAEEAELTFIRCPSCRSLIPAIATRCRMCGHAFEKTSSPAGQTDESQQRSRVRQRTASASAAEVESIKAQAQAQAAATQKPEPVESFETPSKLSSWKEFVSTDSPVADEDIDSTFLEPEPVSRKDPKVESETDDATSDANEPSSWDDAEDGGDDDDFDSEHDADGEGAHGATGEGLRQGGRKRRRRRKKRRSNGTLGGEGGHGSQVSSSFSPSGNAPPMGSSASSAPVSNVPSSVPNSGGSAILQSFSASGTAPAGASYSAGSTASSAPPQSAPQQASVPAGQAAPPRPAAQSVPPPRQQFETPRQQFEAAPQQQVQYQQRRDEVSRPSSPRQVEDRGMMEGMLVGWLVSFREEQNGKALEIRSGRRFIGRGHLRGSDIVYDHDSVSTPHGMLVASDGEGITFQDLMSERGTFVLRSGGKVSEWNQVTHSVQLKHGDRIRFGDYEVLVVLLPR